MRTLVAAAVAVALLAALVAIPLWAKTHTFKLYRDASVNGITLKPGSYELELNGQGEALIYQKGDQLVKARVEVKSIENGSARGSVLVGTDGSLREIRMKERVVVFVR